MSPVTAARKWLGTPYCHQASVRGVGTDCLGLIRGVWRDLYGFEPETVPNYTEDWAEPQNLELLAQAAERHLSSLAMTVEPQPGELLLFRMREGAIAKHLGIRASTGNAPTFIHAYSGHGVVESSLSTPWARRIVARYDFPMPPPAQEN